jgi:hypothetical protein
MLVPARFGLAVVLLVACAEEREAPAPVPAAPAVPDLGGYDPAAFDPARSETWPRTVEQAVAVLLPGLDEKERETIRGMPRGDLIRFHHGWGMGIRNDLGLWRGNDDLLRACGEKHTDDASMVIIEAVWDALQKER